MRVAIGAAVAVAGLVACGQAATGQSIWEMRDPKTAYLFQDYRARQLGDILTVVVNEITESDAQEKRNMNKQTNTSANIKLDGSSSVGNSPTKQFASSFDGLSQSQRKFDGQANSTIDRKFGDKISAVVVDVLPNGNLIVEGYRQRIVSREVRTLKVSGIVRPADIGPFNQIQSQYIANFSVVYMGRGPETNYTNQGWGGRLMNLLWPY
jgi:flagellar L-ring protein precursor FlgH